MTRQLNEDTFLLSFRFCTHCGGGLEQQATTYVRFVCTTCGRTTFVNPKVGVALVIED